MKTQGELFFKYSQLKKKKDYAIYIIIFLGIFNWSVQIVVSIFFFGYLKLVYELMKISILLLFHQYVQI